LIKLLLYILFEKCIHIFALETASPGNQHCANCIGALSFPKDAQSRPPRNKKNNENVAVDVAMQHDYKVTHNNVNSENYTNTKFSELLMCAQHVHIFVQKCHIQHDLA